MALGARGKRKPRRCKDASLVQPTLGRDLVPPLVDVLPLMLGRPPVPVLQSMGELRHAAGCLRGLVAPGALEGRVGVKGHDSRRRAQGNCRFYSECGPSAPLLEPTPKLHGPNCMGDPVLDGSHEAFHRIPSQHTGEKDGPGVIVSLG